MIHFSRPYLLFPDLAKRSDFIAKMKAQDIRTVFHYLPLCYGLGPDQDRVFAVISESLARPWSHPGTA